MRYDVTVRHGRPHRYHTLGVEAEDVAAALRSLADALPPEVVEDADLVELRVAVDPDDRTYVGEE